MSSSVLERLRSRLGQDAQQPTVVCDDGASLIYLLPDVLSPAQAAQHFEELRAWPGWRTETDAFGVQERESAYFGDAGCVFAYVGLTLQPQPWLPCLTTARSLVDETIGSAHGASVTGCLANHYPQNEGRICWHCDEVRAHGDANLVVSLSLGGTRTMDVRENATGKTWSLRLPPGSALVMGGAAQQHWQHALPLDEAGAPERISLTFRSIVPGFEEELARRGPVGFDSCV